MKKLILLMFLITSMFSKDLPSEIVVNECFSDIYYINDMFVLRKDAELHIGKLKEAILQEKYGGNKELMDNLHKFELAYNYSAREKFGDTPQALLFDALEEMEQLRDSSLEAASAFLIAETLLFGPLTNKIPFVKVTKSHLMAYLIQKGLIKEVAEFLADKFVDLAFDEAMNAAVAAAADYDYEQTLEKDLSEMIGKFKKSLQAGHGLVVVSFGQGALFSAQVKRSILLDNLIWTDYIHNIKIAPAVNNEEGAARNSFVMLDNDADLFNKYVPNAALPKVTHINPVRDIVYGVSVVLPEEVAGMYVVEDGTSWSEYDGFEYYEGYWVQGSTLSSFSKVETIFHNFYI